MAQRANKVRYYAARKQNGHRQVEAHQRDNTDHQKAQNGCGELADRDEKRTLDHDAETHDRIVVAGLKELMGKVDVVVLAQASMARVADAIPDPEKRVPILSSPRLGLRLRRGPWQECRMP